jgi:hypothetical protein
MIKLTNRQASALLSPTAQLLFNDPNRNFPVKDTFVLADILQSIDSRIKVYREQLKKIIEANGGEIADDGKITYSKDGDSEKALKEMEELNDIELEYPGRLLKINNDWPKLSLQEAIILKPLIKD